MAFSLTGFLKGLLIQNELDRSKQLVITVSPSATANTSTTLVAAQTANRTITLPDSNFDFNTVVTANSTTTLTNKTIDATQNTLLNISNASISASAAISLSKLALLTANRVLLSDGSGVISASSVTNTTLSYLDVTSSIQTQLNNILPNQATHAGQFLTTNGSVASWAPVSGSGTVTNVTAGTGLNVGAGPGGSITTTGTLNLANTAVSAGSYTNSNITVDAQGRLTSASSGFNASTCSTKNYLLNSDFTLFQRVSSGTAISGQKLFGHDRWYMDNEMGGSGHLVLDQPAGTQSQSYYAARVQVTNAGTSTTIGPRLCQTLEINDSQLLYNQTISFSCWIYSVHNINQVELQFIKNSGQGLGTTNLGSPLNVSISSTPTLIKFENFSVGVLSTNTTIGIQITGNQAISGNPSQNNSDIIVELAMLNIGSVAAIYERQSASIGEELQKCKRYYEKSYDSTIAPAAVTAAGACTFYGTRIDTSYFTSVRYQVEKITNTSSTVTIYNSVTGTSGSIRDVQTSTNVTGSATNKSLNGFYAQQAAVNTGDQYEFQWVANYEMS